MFSKKILKNKLRPLILFLAVLIGFAGFYYFYSQSVNQGLSSSKPSPLKNNEKTEFQLNDEDRVLDLVRNLPEVKKWLSLFSNPDGTSPSTGGKPGIEVDSVDKGIYTIHVFESLPDHNATFNWFYVDPKTGSIKDFFGKEY